MALRLEAGLSCGRAAKILHHLVGEVCCVTKPIRSRQPGQVRIWGGDFPAMSGKSIRRGQWVRVVSCNERALNVIPLNVWLGSCCC